MTTQPNSRSGHKTPVLPQPKKRDPGKEWRRQKRFNTIVLVVTLIGTIAFIAYSLTYYSGQSFPAYLNRCIPLTGRPDYISNPLIQIFIHGQNQTVPANIGVIGRCIRPIHTRATLGVIDIDDFENRDYTLGDFFLVWGNTYGSTFSIFSKDQLFSLKADPANNVTISVLVNNAPDYRYQNFPFPRNANVTSNPVVITIIYGQT